MQSRYYPDGGGALKPRYVSGVLEYYARTSASNRALRLAYAFDPTNRRFQSGRNAADNAGNTLRFNTQTNIGTADSFIGMQVKPRQGASMANNVIGAEFSAQISNTFALTGSGSLIGLHADVYLRGTAAGTIAGDVRCLQLEAVTDDAGTRTISGNVSMLRFRAAFSATTITGKFVPIRIEKPEAQTNSKNFDAVLELTSNLAGIWKDAPATEPTTADGYFKVLVNGNARYVQLYSGAPVD